MSNDTKVTRNDVREVRRHFREAGYAAPMVDVLECEPVLAECVSNRFARIRALLEQAKIEPELFKKIIDEMGKLAVEPLVLLDRAHRRLWDDFLPPSDAAEGEHHG